MEKSSKSLMDTNNPVDKSDIKINRLRNVVVIDKAGYLSYSRLKMSVPFGEFGSASIFRKEGLEVYVEAIPLDEAFENIPYMKLLKVDVEGSEYEVLQSLNKTLNHTEYVVLELSRKADDCLKLLRERGFKCRKMKFSGYYVCCKGEEVINLLFEAETLSLKLTRRFD
jgi:FkbM family methyltransferase